MRIRPLLRLLLSLVVSTLLPQAHATLAIQLTGAPSSSTATVQLSGQTTGYIEWGNYSYLINPGWEFVPASYDPFPAAITANQYGMYSFTSGGAVLRNLTRGWEIQVTGVWLQDSSNSPFIGRERFGALTANAFQFGVGDTLEWSGTGTIDLAASGLTFGSLSTGTSGEICQLGLCGELFVGAVPEPTTALTLLAGLGLLPWLRRTARKRAVGD